MCLSFYHKQSRNFQLIHLNNLKPVILKIVIVGSELKVLLKKKLFLSLLQMLVKILKKLFIVLFLPSFD
jgi:hypothetical protein